MAFALRLTRDTLAARAGSALAAQNRVLYVVDGDVVVRSPREDTRLAADQGWYSPAATEVIAGASGATLLRYELLSTTPAIPPAGASQGVSSEVLLEHAIDLDAARPYLMRCDRVDFEPGAEALPHRHKGGGIRCLIEGSMRLRIEGHADRTVAPGQAWFESGREPVYAAADPQAPTRFIRCSILPREIRGQSSIMYVNPGDAARGRPRRYTVFVDEPIELN